MDSEIIAPTVLFLDQFAVLKENEGEEGERRRGINLGGGDIICSSMSIVLSN